MLGPWPIGTPLSGEPAQSPVWSPWLSNLVRDVNVRYLLGLAAYLGATLLALVAPLLTVIVSDSAQFYTGRAFGQRLLAPAISPKKTVEGVAGGFLFGGLLLAVVGAWLLPAVALPLRATLGVTIVALGIAGDLFESMLKRSAGVKDSSALIPGHGGILDRIDSLIYVAPLFMHMAGYYHELR